MASLVLGVVIISEDDNGGRQVVGNKKIKIKIVYLKRGSRVALLLQVTFILMHFIGLPRILIVAESKEKTWNFLQGDNS